MKKNNVISFSGGKDSTAMLHWMLEKGEDIHSVVFFDTGWEFPEMSDHIKKVEKNTGLEIIKLTSVRSFDDWMFNRKIKAIKGEMKGEVHKIGYGWPSPIRRWCTRIKVDRIKKYQRSVEGAVACVGIAADESHRAKDQRYPLIEYNKTELDCLNYCKDIGYDWGGLYEIFDRVSCWCCPLQKLSDLRKLRKVRPKLWSKLLDMDMRQPRHNPGFREYWSAVDLEIRFRKEDKQGSFDFCQAPCQILTD